MFKDGRYTCRRCRTDKSIDDYPDYLKVPYSSSRGNIIDPEKCDDHETYHGPMHFICSACLTELTSEVVPGRILKVKELVKTFGAVMNWADGTSSRSGYYDLKVGSGDIVAVVATAGADSLGLPVAYFTGFKDHCSIALLVLSGESKNSMYCDKLYRLHHSYDFIA